MHGSMLGVYGSCVGFGCVWPGLVCFACRSSIHFQPPNMSGTGRALCTVNSEDYFTVAKSLGTSVLLCRTTPHEGDCT